MEVSFLSDNVKELLCSTNTELLSSPTCHLQLPQGTIQWKSLQHVFKDLDQLPPDYTEHVQKLAPVCFKISSWLKTQNIEDLKEKYSKHLQWTGQPEVFYECFDVLQSNNACSTHVSLLLLTATLERAMGDVYLTKNSPCPSMLKDLLAAPELCLLFGCTAIKMLHILIGPPTSLNLRNIFWHGFASPGEIPIMYAYFLIIIAVSLGEVLCSNHELVQIPHRQWFTFSNINLTKQTTTVIENVEKDELMAIIYNSNFIQKNMICLWEQALQYYYSGRFGLFLMLLLPQMEMGVRTVFVQANNCPHRLVTAESSVLLMRCCVYKSKMEKRML
ncbi:endoplasmic reticulum membrane-associated RNA degradation protein-like isoform X2 [Antedon mediterranea]